MSKHTNKTATWRYRALALGLAPVLGLVGAGVSLVASAVPANAATSAAGYGSYGTNDFIGAFIAPNGSDAYCINPGASLPKGATVDAGITSNVDGLSADTLAQINYVTTKYGQTGSNVQAAAASFVVKYLADPSGMISEEGNPGTTFDSQIVWQATTIGGDDSAVKSLADQYLSEAQAISAVPATSAGSASAAFTVDATNNYNGTLTVHLSPSPATGTVTLTNGVFASDGSNALTGSFTDGEVLPVSGVAPAKGAPYKISATGVLGAATPGGYAGNVHLYTTDGEQSIVSGGSMSAGTAAEKFSASDPQPRTVTFQPVATTAAGSASVTEGGDLADTVTAQTVANAAGVNNSWFKYAGQYDAVVFNGAAYYSATKVPDGSPVPASAAKVGSATLSFGGGATNPTGTSQTATIKSGATKSGYYYWVWSVAYANQDAASTQLDIPGSLSNPVAPDYNWVDNAHTAETQIVPATVTTTASKEQALGLAKLTDTLHVSGVATPDEGFTVTDKLYKLTSTVNQQGVPVASGTQTCTAANLVFTAPSVSIPNTGDYTTAAYTPTTAGLYGWVESLVSPTGAVLSSADCGTTVESTTVPQLIVTTTASQASDGVATDSATVSGTVPADAQVAWSLYQQDGASASAADQLLATTAAKGLPTGVLNAFVIDSPTVKYTSTKPVYFVETVVDVNGTPIETGLRGVSSESLTASGVHPTGNGGNGGNNAGNGGNYASPVVSG